MSCEWNDIVEEIEDLASYAREAGKYDGFREVLAMAYNKSKVELIKWLEERLKGRNDGRTD